MFGDYDFDEHPFKGLGGYDQARRVFGGQFAGGYPDPAQNAEQLSFLIYFYMFTAADAARVRAARRPGAKPYAGAFAGEWTLRNPRNAREPGSETVPRETLRWSDWANALNGQRLVSWVREEVFPFQAGIAAEGVTDLMADARLVIDEPTVLSQVEDEKDSPPFCKRILEFVCGGASNGPEDAVMAPSEHRCGWFGRY